jgi:hypothetical protein
MRVNLVRHFDGNSASYSYATGFVVDASRGLILSNRHVVTTGARSARCAAPTLLPGCLLSISLPPSPPFFMSSVHLPGAGVPWVLPSEPTAPVVWLRSPCESRWPCGAVCRAHHRRRRVPEQGRGHSCAHLPRPHPRLRLFSVCGERPHTTHASAGHRRVPVCIINPPHLYRTCCFFLAVCGAVCGRCCADSTRPSSGARALRSPCSPARRPRAPPPSPQTLTIPALPFPGTRGGRYMRAVEIPLVPSEAHVGAEIRVIGNDSGEKVRPSPSPPLPTTPAPPPSLHQLVAPADGGWLAHVRPCCHWEPRDGGALAPAPASCA